MNAREIKKSNAIYVFVTRDEASPISDEEIEEFFSKEYDISSFGFIPDNRARRNLFIKDLRMGLGFCSRKYGVSTEDVKSEAERLAPNIKVKL